MRDWEEKFRQWARPPGKTEENKCQNAENAIKNAIKKSDKLNSLNIRIFTQGSYRNNTNVRKDSDVDIGIICCDPFFVDLPEGYDKNYFGLVDTQYHYEQFKNDVGKALTKYFGSKSVSRDNKAFDIHENTYHVEADVAPFFEHRLYRTNKTYIKPSGVELWSDNGDRVINWPEQHYSNGVSKNNDTSRRYKALVRILKGLRNEMADTGIPFAEPIKGFLIECLVWNIPNNSFGCPQYIDDVRSGLTFLFNNTINDEKCKNWSEVNTLKYLFHPSQKWTREQVHSFIDSAWNYIGFK